MNKLQQQSLQAQDARYLTDILDEGFTNDGANHTKTQAMLGELLNRSNHTNMGGLPLSFGGVTINREHYNLFVIGGEKFNNGNFVISKSDVFPAEYIEADIKKQYMNLRDDNVVMKIFSLPSIFMSENIDFLQASPRQRVLFGRVTDLEINPNDIRIAYTVESQIYQQSITDISHDLGILDNPGCSELNRTHWTIKKVDLLKVLSELALMV